MSLARMNPRSEAQGKRTEEAVTAQPPGNPGKASLFLLYTWKFYKRECVIKPEKL